jgi:hypothetical protein
MSQSDGPAGPRRRGTARTCSRPKRQFCLPFLLFFFSVYNLLVAIHLHATRPSKGARTTAHELTSEQFTNCNCRADPQLKVLSWRTAQVAENCSKICIYHKYSFQINQFSAIQHGRILKPSNGVVPKYIVQLLVGKFFHPLGTSFFP